ncbi:unnamed protein product [Caenorhabditis auriculariae]|uniref:Uncharacterized protein n=1 Tax=Caenorhabditis auriculariae TaxID=2777116 RepID=A0A8S1GSM1_9PELO|nr:unnamed protein product [Caenorhabditis auriculariae]
MIDIIPIAVKSKQKATERGIKESGERSKSKREMKLFITASVFLFSLVQGCPPTPAPTSAPEEQPDFVAEGPSRVFKRAAEGTLVLVTIVTTKPFDPSVNDANARSIYAAVEGFAAENNVQLPQGDHLSRMATNNGGKLAVKLLVKDPSASCEAVNQFARAAKQSVAEVNYTTINCEGSTTVV